jgi:hypothetical protein
MNYPNSASRLIALYLPQFHPIPENDEWWGKGFTEWTNTARAKPMFRGHYQPHVPADLGFYDLRVPETRNSQAELAREYGIEAFCYYHYWFAGKRLLERPFNEVLESGMPDFPFCLCWANETWSGIWHGAPEKLLIEQTYPGYDDHINHFASLARAFKDNRYLKVDGKPIFFIYRPRQIPKLLQMTQIWREQARKEGLPGLHMVAMNVPPSWVPQEFGFDASVLLNMPLLRKQQWISRRQPLKLLKRKYLALRAKPTVYSYSEIYPSLLQNPSSGIESYPCAVHSWDNTPRSRSNGLVLQGSTPELFRKHLQAAINMARQLPPERRIVLLKSWNEWAEGNHLEPDHRFGRSYLQVIREETQNHYNV